MIGGIGLFGALTANFEFILVKNGDESSAGVVTLAEEVRLLREELALFGERFPPQ